jgi:hypothetical protein
LLSKIEKKNPTALDKQIVVFSFFVFLINNNNPSVLLFFSSCFNQLKAVLLPLFRAPSNPHRRRSTSAAEVSEKRLAEQREENETRR